MEPEIFRHRRHTSRPHQIPPSSPRKWRLEGGAWRRAHRTHGAFHRHRVVIGARISLSGYMIEKRLVFGLHRVGMGNVFHVRSACPPPRGSPCGRGSLRADLGVMITGPSTIISRTMAFANSSGPTDRNCVRMWWKPRATAGLIGAAGMEAGAWAPSSKNSARAQARG